MNTMFSPDLVSAFSSAQSVVAFTGAGVSAESGVPTFRGDEGIWKKFNAEELASMTAFMKNPELVWQWYAHRKKIISDTQPNPGHYALAKMEMLFTSFAVITQNIDNLHFRAGSKTVHELHGNIERSYCVKCGTPFGGHDIPTSAGAALCPKCDGLIRPDVVWFGELLPEEEWSKAVRAAESADVFLSIGTSGVVYPAASIPSIARRNGAFVVEINPEPTPLTDHVDAFIKGQSGLVLPALYDLLVSQRQFQNSK
jgi:NAD-dependent protein deacetylase/lipoamidase